MNKIIFERAALEELNRPELQKLVKEHGLKNIKGNQSKEKLINDIMALSNEPAARSPQPARNGANENENSRPTRGAVRASSRTRAVKKEPSEASVKGARKRKPLQPADAKLTPPRESSDDGEAHPETSTTRVQHRASSTDNPSSSNTKHPELQLPPELADDFSGLRDNVGASFSMLTALQTASRSQQEQIERLRRELEEERTARLEAQSEDEIKEETSTAYDKLRERVEKQIERVDGLSTKVESSVWNAESRQLQSDFETLRGEFRAWEGRVHKLVDWDVANKVETANEKAGSAAEDILGLQTKIKELRSTLTTFEDRLQKAESAAMDRPRVVHLNKRTRDTEVDEEEDELSDDGGSQLSKRPRLEAGEPFKATRIIRTTSNGVVITTTTTTMGR